MEYNSTRNRLILREYGRNVQRMVESLMTIEDIETRTQSAKAIINVMSQLNPSIREVGDVRHKLWDHLDKGSVGRRWGRQQHDREWWSRCVRLQ